MVSIPRLSTYMQIISVVFHPVLVPTYAFFSIWHLHPAAMIRWSAMQQFHFAVLLLLSYTVLPALLVYSAYTLGWISTLRMAQNERRVMLLLLACWYMLASTACMKWIALPLEVSALLSIGTILLFVLWALNFVLKISVHAAAMATIAAYCVVLGVDSGARSLFELGSLLIACTGFVMSSRLYLKAHRASEVYIGAGTGLSIGTYGYILFFHF